MGIHHSLPAGETLYVQAPTRFQAFRWKIGHFEHEQPECLGALPAIKWSEFREHVHGHAVQLLPVHSYIFAMIPFLIAAIVLVILMATDKKSRIISSSAWFGYRMHLPRSLARNHHWLVDEPQEQEQ